MAKQGSRRTFLTWCGAAGSLLTVPGLGSAATTERRIALLNLHTGERVDAVYWAEGAYLPEAMARINRVLRDHRNDAVTEMDPALIDALHRLRSLLRVEEAVQIVSAYRSPESNAALRRTTNGVARNSYHVRGQATDLRLPGVPLWELRKAARHMKVGGVGYYPLSDFVHLDTGRVRMW